MLKLLKAETRYYQQMMKRMCVLCVYVYQCVLYVLVVCLYVNVCNVCGIYVCVYTSLCVSVCGYCDVYTYVSVYVGVVWMCMCLCINTYISTPYWAYQFLSKCYLHLIFLVICMYVYLCVVHACEYSLPQRSEVLLNLELLKVVNHPN